MSLYYCAIIRQTLCKCNELLFFVRYTDTFVVYFPQLFEMPVIFVLADVSFCLHIFPNVSGQLANQLTHLHHCVFESILLQGGTKIKPVYL